jgi:DNA-binding SARP family transcriptional activator
MPRGAAVPAQCVKVPELQNPPVRVFTLGRFDVEVDLAPLRFGRKAQRRPLDLLKLLIAYGGEGVSDEQIAEDLWPDAEGDAALAALRTTLSRLRRLIGARSVLGNVRRLSLNPEVCWVDALTAERLLAASRRSAQSEDLDAALASLEQALELYRGLLLPGESHLPPVVSARAKLHSLFLRCLAEVAQRCESAGQADKAMDLYRRALEIDEAEEDIARRLMRCCRSTGRAAEGIAVYRRCEAALRSQLGAAPSAVTQGAFQNLLATPSSAPAPGELTVAVLRFQDLSPARGHQRLADAIRETVISLLDAVPELSLVTSDAMEVPWHVAPDPGVRQRGPAVRYLLRGSVLVSGTRLRAGVELIDANTGLHAWSEQLDQELDDVIRAQDRIAIQVAEGLTAKLIRGQCVGLLLSPDIHVWKALSQIRVLMDRQTKTDHLRARALIGRLLDFDRLDPLLLGLQVASDVVAAWKCWVANPKQTLRSSEMRLRQLQRKYSANTYVPYILPYACTLRGEFGEALRLARKHVDRMPENFFSHAFVGTALLYEGRDAEAVGKLEDAINIRPEPLHWLFKDRAVAQFRLGRYEDAIGGLARVLVDDHPLHRHADLRSARLMYVGSLAAAGRMDQARHEARVALATDASISARAWSRWHFQWYKDDAIAPRMERLLVGAGVPT